jgi:hypothetical protein
MHDDRQAQGQDAHTSPYKYYSDAISSAPHGMGVITGLFGNQFNQGNNYKLVF